MPGRRLEGGSPRPLTGLLGLRGDDRHSRQVRKAVRSSRGPTTVTYPHQRETRPPQGNRPTVIPAHDAAGVQKSSHQRSSAPPPTRAPDSSAPGPLGRAPSRSHEPPVQPLGPSTGGPREPQTPKESCPSVLPSTPHSALPLSAECVPALPRATPRAPCPLYPHCRERPAPPSFHRRPHVRRVLSTPTAACVLLLSPSTGAPRPQTP